ncbi:polar amino acid transport system substrate-binding protein [Mesorhizobium soli]|uniref:transporter substrate-binding domain-containing protein n=1 Tax=Pseudaminobacter soli (ex Li et al. 2025) TaxID=1295366 RepID=UPI002474B0D5|nr:transporter substrate-binding domain-containing protein [Mesorhizobium soli]MDH6232180.1 polar amino acid transport system substrate-binding protein [Mesorhizobium soli]
MDHIHATGILRSPFPDIWPPAVIKNDKGELDGFDVEVLREVGKRIGVKVDYVTNADGSIITWEEQTSGNWQGKYDIVINSMTPTAKRAEHVAFPVNYYYTIGVLAVHRDNTSIHTPADASGKRIGALKASKYDQYLRRQPFGIVGVPPITYKIENPTIVNFDHEDDVFSALAKGDGVELDGFVNDVPIVMSLIKEGKPFKIIGQPLYHTPSAVAILPGDPELADLLAKTVEAMRADGTLSKLSTKWFEYDMINE